MIKRCLLMTLCLGLLAGCSSLSSQHGSQPIPRDGRMAVVPLINLSQTPQAGDQAASILSAILRSRAVSDVRLYLPEDDNPMLYESQARQQQALASAEADGAEWLMSGTVEEWRYKNGIDGEPAVGVTLEVRRPGETTVVWSGTAARTGWGREGLGVAGRKLLETLVDAMPLTDRDE